MSSRTLRRLKSLCYVAIALWPFAVIATLWRHAIHPMSSYSVNAAAWTLAILAVTIIAAAVALDALIYDAERNEGRS